MKKNRTAKNRATKNYRRGSALVEVVVALPCALVALQGMMMLYSAHLARQRTYAALPEMARRGVMAFSPHAEARCRVEGFRNAEGSSLSADESAACSAAEYLPPQELRRIQFRAETRCSGEIRMNTKYAVVGLDGR